MELVPTTTKEHDVKSYRRTMRRRTVLSRRAIQRPIQQNHIFVKIPKDFDANHVARNATEILCRYLLCSRGLSPLPVEQLLCLDPTKKASDSRERQYHRRLVQLRDQVIALNESLADVFAHNDLSVAAVVISIGSSLTRPRHIYWVDVSSLSGSEPLSSGSPFGRKVIQSILTHDAGLGACMARQQMRVTVGARKSELKNSRSVINRMIPRRDFVLDTLLKTSGVESVCHIRVLHGDDVMNELDWNELSWFSIKATVTAVNRRHS